MPTADEEDGEDYSASLHMVAASQAADGTAYYQLKIDPAVQEGLTGTSSSRSWMITKRYSEFVELKEALERNHTTHISSFPWKHLFRNGDRVIDERKVGLLDFIHQCVKTPVMREDPTLHAFLDLTQSHGGVSKASPEKLAALARGDYGERDEDTV